MIYIIFSKGGQLLTIFLYYILLVLVVFPRISAQKTYFFTPEQQRNRYLTVYSVLVQNFENSVFEILISLCFIWTFKESCINFIKLNEQQLRGIDLAHILLMLIKTFFKLTKPLY